MANNQGNTTIITQIPTIIPGKNGIKRLPPSLVIGVMTSNSNAAIQAAMT